MTDFTEEEVEERVRSAVEKEQRSIAGDQFYREGLMAVAQKVQAGVYDGYIYEVGAEEYDRFKKENPLQAKKKKKGAREKNE